MRLADYKGYDSITIQCHDNPDADTLASGFALKKYFESLGVKETKLIYSGRNQIQKPNLKLMVEQLGVPIEYVENVNEYVEGFEDKKIPGLLITVDCQYGAGNVTKIPAMNTAIVDHHQQEVEDRDDMQINSHLGSCSTLVWSMLRDEGYEIKDMNIGTALYYGLYTDTNSFAEIYNPLDMDMRDAIICEKSKISLFRNSNLSLHEMELAGIALIKNIYNNDYDYGVIKAYECDPNILGLISDIFIQVAEITTCVVYNELRDGLKFSVRSCTKEVAANELAAFIAEGIGSGGGHREKAGGFIKKKLYEEKYPTLHTEGYFSARINEYYDTTTVIYAEEYEIDTTDFAEYQKRQMPFGYVEASKILPVGSHITVRTLEGDVDIDVTEDLIIMIGIKGEVYPSMREKFERSYRVVDGSFFDENGNSKYDLEYIPTIHNRDTGEVMPISQFAGLCMSRGGTRIKARELRGRVKVFTSWDKEKYMLGKPGDYLAVRSDDAHDIYVVERDIFFKSYDEVK